MGHQRKDYPNNAPAKGLPPKPNTSQRFQTWSGNYPINAQADKVGTSNSGQGAMSGRPRAEVRVFAMTRQEAQVTPDVVIGMLSIFYHDVYILIDYGSTHSYLPPALSMHTDKRLSQLDYGLMVSMLVEESFVANQVYGGCSI